MAATALSQVCPAQLSAVMFTALIYTQTRLKTPNGLCSAVFGTFSASSQCW